MKLAFFLAQTSSPPYFRKLMKKSFRIPPLRVSVPESAKNRVTSSLWVGSPRVRRIFRMSKLLWVQSDLKLTFFRQNSTFLECSQNQVCYSSGKNKDPIHPSFWLYKSLMGGTAIWSCNFWWTAKSTSPPWIWNGRLPPVFLIEHLTTIDRPPPWIWNRWLTNN